MAASTLSPVPPIEAAFPADAVVNPKTHSATQLPKDHDSAPSASQRAKSALFTPLTINAGGITLSHRIVMAPMTRNRGIPVNIGRPNRAWKPSPSVATYYAQRATPGGLIITEGIPPSQEGTGSPAVPGLFLPEQVPGWKAVVDAVHAKGGYIYAQLWHGGRACLPHFTGLESVSASATPFGEGMESRYPPPDEDADDAIPGHGDRVAMSDFPPREMTKGDIAKTISDFVSAARRAVEECGFDGIEIHGGNGYIVEQFLSTNVNKRFDEYGGSVEGYCRFPLELMQGLAEAVGGQRVAIRLSPFGMFNQSYGAQRMEIWSHFCRRLKDAVPNLSYIHFIEPVSASRAVFTWHGGLTNITPEIRANHRGCSQRFLSQVAGQQCYPSTIS